MKKTLHLIYPFDLKKKINPWSIGNNIYHALKNDFKIINYNWMSFGKIYPKKGDILIGHGHPNPFTIFRRSIENSNWHKKILIQPYNEDPLQMSHLYDLIPKCDDFIAICGEYWKKRINKSKFKSWKKKITQIDLAIHESQYPFIKKKINKKNNRKILYIGNDYAFNNFAKNTEYLKKISQLVGENIFGTIGNKSVGNIKHYGWLNLQDKKNLNIIKKYDFLIQTSKNDANPLTVLEAMSWGLIPIITKECGYKQEQSIMNIPLNNLKFTVNKIKKLQSISNKYLKKIQFKNKKLLKNYYKWDLFKKKIKKIVLKQDARRSNISYSKHEIYFFQKNLKKSPNYFLNLDTLYNVFRSNIKIFIDKLTNF